MSFRDLNYIRCDGGWDEIYLYGFFILKIFGIFGILVRIGKVVLFSRVINVCS